MRAHPFVVLIGGAAGCGKSTLATQLAPELGATVVSTDHIRHMIRAYLSPQQSPLCYASTYTAGESLSLEAGSEKNRIIAGYTAQCELVFSKLSPIIQSYLKRKESLIVEGVHLTGHIMNRLQKKIPCCVSVSLVIREKAKHKEAFAFRAKNMALDCTNNKYIKHFERIRLIQDFQRETATIANIPVVDNSSLASSKSKIKQLLRLKGTIECKM